MRSFVRFTIVAYCIEAVLVALLVFFPGAGHSPFWYTRIPVLVAVGLIEPTAGTCFQCAPAAFAVGMLAQLSLILAAVGLLGVVSLLSSRFRFT